MDNEWKHLTFEESGGHHIWFKEGDNRGFYFSDESEGMNGPFPSSNEALENFNSYCKEFLT